MVQIALPPDTVAPATRWRTGLLLAAPTVVLAARLLTTPWYQDDDDTPDTARVLTEVATSATANDLGATLALVGGVLYAAVAVVLGLWLRPAVPRTATAGLLLGALGGFGLAVCADQQLTIGQAAALTEQRTAMVALLDRVYDSPQAGLSYGLLVLGAVGWVLLGVALARSRAVPSAAAVVAALGGAAVMVTAPGPARAFVAGAAVISLVGLAWVALAARRRRSVAGLAVAMVVAMLGSGCAGDTADADGAAAPAPPDSTSTSSSSSSPPGDPLATPSLEGRYAVTPDGRELALVCWGEGSPTVLLETGGTNTEEWAGTGVVRELAGRTRVCTYDRAGTGRSDPAPDERRDADDVVTEADALLDAAGVTGPLVLVGRSFGGMIVTHYAETLPDDVVGVVVVDTPAPSAEFTEESEPGLVWDARGNTEHLDVVHGFENRFAADPPRFDVPLLLVSPDPGEASARNERFWLQASPDGEQVTCPGEPTEGACAGEVAAFVEAVDLTPAS